jgi:hypothetical protein
VPEVRLTQALQAYCLNPLSESQESRVEVIRKRRDLSGDNVIQDFDLPGMFHYISILRSTVRV